MPLTDKPRPGSLRGLRQAVYVLQCLADGKTEQEIADTLEGDMQLVKIWSSFVLHSHFIENQRAHNGVMTWVVTDKGKDLLNKYS